MLRHPRRGRYLECDQPWSDETEGELVAARNELVAVQSGGDRARWVEHWMHGEASYFLAACFVPQSVAERVMADFMASGRPSGAAAWEPLDTNPHKRESPPPDGLLHWVLGRRPVVEAADPPHPSDG